MNGLNLTNKFLTYAADQQLNENEFARFKIINDQENDDIIYGIVSKAMMGGVCLEGFNNEGQTSYKHILETEGNVERLIGFGKAIKTKVLEQSKSATFTNGKLSYKGYTVEFLKLKSIAQPILENFVKQKLKNNTYSPIKLVHHKENKEKFAVIINDGRYTDIKYFQTHQECENYIKASKNNRLLPQLQEIDFSEEDLALFDMNAEYKDGIITYENCEIHILPKDV